ncbi:glutaredoxin family protein [Alteromonas sp. a30]|uniref:glutaredoxin family protein n=1 Tax=Alteromonas sp. a30 TaxID=2730917 RepID=UPI00227F748C|nr:glutaredoxin family protein [Alteromonas sp. a30]MCY7293899.1 glutaredoxin family protein [Alteromonas sp. a30]
MTLKLTLFSGSECSLCDMAKAMLDEQAGDFDVTSIDVKAQREYFHEYGARIPVVKREDNLNELPWPFDANQLTEFLK